MPSHGESEWLPANTGPDPKGTAVGTRVFLLEQIVQVLSEPESAVVPSAMF